jgi:hypothetical protein
VVTQELSEIRKQVGRAGGLRTWELHPRDRQYFISLNLESQRARGFEPLEDMQARIMNSKEDRYKGNSVSELRKTVVQLYPQLRMGSI